MKILQLHLVAFGPFTDHTLLFEQPAGGLHIVYGANEAGKSSSLRGLKALLYGIETRTTDNHRHANDKLRISGRVCNADGQDLAFTRRKGRKKTLLTMGGEALDEQALAPFLQGVSAELFNTLFGIDHPALVQGGREILEQKGEVGQALFSAALGSHALHAVLGALDDEADGLFKPRGSTQEINLALKAHADLKRRIREHSLSSRDWDAHRAALERTHQALQTVQSELAGKRNEISRLRRIQRVLPKLARRGECLRELEGLRDAAILADDFSERRRRALQDLEKARAIVDKTRPRLEEYRKQLDDLSLRGELLQQAENIEALHARLGSHRKALQDRPHLEAESRQLLNDAAALLKEVRPDLEPDAAEVLRPLLARRQGIVELGSQHALLVSRVEQAESNRRETDNRLRIARRELEGLPLQSSPEALRRAIAVGRKSGDLDAAIRTAQTRQANTQERCDAELSRLGLWSGTLQELPGLALPNRESIQRFEQAFDEWRQQVQRLRDKQQALVDGLDQHAQGLDALRRGGAPPSEADLAAARALRDRIWGLLRRHMEGQDVADQAARLPLNGSLPDGFEDHMAAADEVADRLRREADRVHTLATLQAAQAAGQRQLDAVVRQLEALAEEQDRRETAWQDLWAPCSIQATSPREMRAWLDGMEKLRERAGQLSEDRHDIAALQQTRHGHIQALEQYLRELGEKGASGESLEQALLEGEAVACRLDDGRRQRASLEKDITQLQDALATYGDQHQAARRQLDEWRQQWRRLLEDFGLPLDSGPAEMADFIEKVRALFAKRQEADKLRIRIKAISDDARNFTAQVEHMLSSVAPELAELPVDDAVVRLNALLAEQRADQTRRRQIQQQLDQARQDIEDSQAVIQAARARLQALCVEAKCSDPDELDEVERRAAARLRLVSLLNGLEQEILEAGEGASIAQLQAQAADIDADLLPGRIRELSDSIDDELEPRRTELAQDKGREEKELELMNGSDQAAELADQAHATLAGIRADAARYVRAKLAGRVLREQIERYRQDNQGPLVKRTSEHFARLTLDSFTGLITDFNDKDEPVLVGVRARGERVYVEGMSSGTRDQLYLALRLASLEKYMESAEPMPFIVDDVLVDFDDQRSQAALAVLCGLAQKTQVIVFTHHSQVVEQARCLPDPVRVHEL